MSVLAWITPVPLAAIGGKGGDSPEEAPCQVLSVPIRIDLEELKRLALSNIGTGKAAFLDLGAVSREMPNKAWFVVFHRGIQLPIYRYPLRDSRGKKYWVYKFYLLEAKKEAAQLGKEGEEKGGRERGSVSRSRAPKEIKQLAEKHIDEYVGAEQLKQQPEVRTNWGAFERLMDGLPAGRSIHEAVEDFIRGSRMLFKHFARLGKTPDDPIDTSAVPTYSQLAAERIAAEMKKTPRLPALIKDLLPLYIKRVGTDFAKKVKGCTSQSSMNRRIGQAKLYAKVFGERLAHLVDTWEIADYFHGKTHLHFDDARVFLGALRHFFLFMYEKDALPQAVDADGDPLTPASRVRLIESMFEPKGPTTPPGIYTVVDADKIAQACLTHPDREVRAWGVAVLLRLFCGLHLIEVMYVYFRELLGDIDVDQLEGHTFYVTQDAAGPNHKAHYAELAPGHYAFLRPAIKLAIAQGRLDEKVIPGLPAYVDPRSAQQDYEDKFQMNFDKILAHAGVAKVPNGLRHSFASYLLHLTWNLMFVTMKMGSGSITVLKRYVNLRVLRPQADAYFRIHPPEVHEEMAPFLPPAPGQQPLRPWPDPAEYRSEAEARAQMAAHLATARSR